MTSNLKEIFLFFLQMGFTAFGGPAAHVSYMLEELVEKRKWLDKETFLDLYGATNIIPGPNSTELVLHIGYIRAGILGMLVAGIGFILPPMLMILGIGFAYIKYGTLPIFDGLLYGIKPIVLAIIFVALIKLWNKAIKDPISYLFLPFIVLLSLFFNFSELMVMIIFGILMMFYSNRSKISKKAYSISFLSFVINDRLLTVFLTFLKIGSLLYGGGYVLLVFIESNFVEQLGFITESQLLDAIAIGQFTPGPLFTTAAFVGVVSTGTIWGGIVATIGIFLPSFLLVGLLQKIMPLLRKNTYLSGFLDGLIVTSLGLMIAVIIKLVPSTVLDVSTAILTIIAFVLIYKYRFNTAIVIMAGGMIGYIINIF
jgi:chromate transporter